MAPAPAITATARWSTSTIPVRYQSRHDPPRGFLEIPRGIAAGQVNQKGRGGRRGESPGPGSPGELDGTLHTHESAFPALYRALTGPYRCLITLVQEPSWERKMAAISSADTPCKWRCTSCGRSIAGRGSLGAWTACVAVGAGRDTRVVPPARQ